MALPPRAHYSLTEAAARWDCTIADIAGWSSVGKLELVTGIGPVTCGAETISGLVAIPAADILSTFERCGGVATERPLKRIRPLGKSDWCYITEPVDGVIVAAREIIIMATEVHRFEEECDLLRRPHGGLGPTQKYDWDAMYLAVILRLHEGGLPETQAEFVGEFQDWFAGRSETGEVPDESTIRRKLNPIWRALRER